MAEHLYIVSYDIADTKRWRQVFKTMQAYGDWVQLSVFQCRMSRKRHAELIALLDSIILRQADHILLMDLGLAEEINPQVVSLGKAFDAIERVPIIV